MDINIGHLLITALAPIGALVGIWYKIHVGIIKPERDRRQEVDQRLLSLEKDMQRNAEDDKTKHASLSRSIEKLEEKQQDDDSDLRLMFTQFVETNKSDHDKLFEKVSGMSSEISGIKSDMDHISKSVDRILDRMEK